MLGYFLEYTNLDNYGIGGYIGIYLHIYFR